MSTRPSSSSTVQFNKPQIHIKPSNSTISLPALDLTSITEEQAERILEELNITYRNLVAETIENDISEYTKQGEVIGLSMRDYHPFVKSKSQKDEIYEKTVDMMIENHITYTLKDYDVSKELTPHPPLSETSGSRTTSRISKSDSITSSRRPFSSQSIVFGRWTPSMYNTGSSPHPFLKETENEYDTDDSEEDICKTPRDRLSLISKKVVGQTGNQLVQMKVEQLANIRLIHGPLHIEVVINDKNN